MIGGDLADAAPWRAALAGVDTVVHLAAATGKVRRTDHFEIIRNGTRRVLEAAQAAGVRRVLYVSSVAVVYRDRPYYHYAQAKADAEQLVGTSGLDYLIVRPTLVLGPGSAPLAGLRRLALLPIPLIFGSGKPLVQPVHVDDLARLLAAALKLPRWGGSAITVGGPDTVSLDQLLLRIRATARPDGRKPVHLPLAPARLVLSLLEPILLPLLPFTAGQLAFFANPAVAEPHPLLAELPVPTLGLAEMLDARIPE